MSSSPGHAHGLEMHTYFSTNDDGMYISIKIQRIHFEIHVWWLQASILALNGQQIPLSSKDQVLPPPLSRGLISVVSAKNVLMVLVSPFQGK